jgi:hypothetical protein
VKRRSVHYFAVDGSFGHADGINLIETDKWIESDWQLIEETPEHMRAAFALDIATWVRLGRPEDFWAGDYTIASKYINSKRLG